MSFGNFFRHSECRDAYGPNGTRGDMSFLREEIRHYHHHDMEEIEEMDPDFADFVQMHNGFTQMEVTSPEPVVLRRSENSHRRGSVTIVEIETIKPVVIQVRHPNEQESGSSRRRSSSRPPTGTPRRSQSMHEPRERNLSEGQGHDRERSGHARRSRHDRAGNTRHNQDAFAGPHPGTRRDVHYPPMASRGRPPPPPHPPRPMNQDPSDDEVYERTRQFVESLPAQPPPPPPSMASASFSHGSMPRPPMMQGGYAGPGSRSGSYPVYANLPPPPLYNTPIPGMPAYVQGFRGPAPGFGGGVGGSYSNFQAGEPTMSGALPQNYHAHHPPPSQAYYHAGQPSNFAAGPPPGFSSRGGPSRHRSTARPGSEYNPLPRADPPPGFVIGEVDSSQAGSSNRRR